MDIVHKYSSPEGLQRDGKAKVSPWGFMIQVCVMCPLNKAFHPEGGKKIQNGVKTFAQKRYLTFFLVFLFSQVSRFLTYAFHHQWNRLLFSAYLFSRRVVIPVAKKSKVPSSYLHWPRNCSLLPGTRFVTCHGIPDLTDPHLFTISAWALVIGVKKSGEAVESVMLPLDWERAVAPSSSINKCGLLLLF